MMAFYVTWFGVILLTKIMDGFIMNEELVLHLVNNKLIVSFKTID